VSPRRANVRPDEPGRERVLDAAGELFAAKGFDATSIAEIGTRADIAKSVLYHHFGSKAGLYVAILEAETAELVRRVAAAVPEDPDAPRLRAGVDAYLGYLRERPAAAALLLRDAPADPALAEPSARLAAEREQALVGLLATPQKRLGAAAHVGLMVTAIRAFGQWWLEHPEVPQEQVADAIMDVARAGAERVRAPTPRAR
jgi:AcrR family transcriptional regulator